MTRSNTAALRTGKTAASATGLGVILAHLWDQALQWQERARSRHVLSMMDETALKDIGLSRSMAETEINKPFWRG